MVTLESVYPPEKAAMYSLLKKQLLALVDGERRALPNLANASALIFGALRDINWAGFYLMDGGELVLGPFQGKPACTVIKLGRGVCGTAAEQKETQLVPDVHLFPGHIACDGASRSEIVIPLVKDGAVLGVLDIDSPITGRFDSEDKAGLQALAAVLENGCNW